MRVTRGFVAEIFNATENIPISVALLFETTDPLAVSFVANGGETVWQFAREFLSEGLKSPRKFGEHASDVFTRRTGDSFVLTLSSPEGTAEVLLPAHQVQEFVDEIDSVLPAQRASEVFDLGIDIFLSECLSEE